MWRIIFSDDSQGYLNSLLMNWGIILEPIQFLQSPQYLMTIMILFLYGVVWVLAF
jgi:multiple sugar transport system permease protein